MAINRAAQSARALLEQTAAEVANLPGPALRAIGPVLFQAERELAQDLAKWLRTVDNGAARFTAQQYRVALVQIRQALRTARGLNPALFNVMNTAGVEAGALALGHLARQAEQFSLLFEHSLRPMPIRPAAVLAEGRKALIPRFKASAARYGEYVTKDIQRELAVGVARGETFDQLTRRLMRHGGPKGMVTVRGIEGDRGAVSEHIAEGLFKRYRSRAETVVRTETINAYNVVAQDGIEAANAEDPGFLKRWDASLDWRLCPLCRSLDGKVAKVGERFGSGYEHPPAHPNCRCALTPWHVEWGESVASVPVGLKVAKPVPSPLPTTAPSARPGAPPAKQQPAAPRPAAPTHEPTWTPKGLLEHLRSADPTSAVPMLEALLEDVNGTRGMARGLPVSKITLDERLADDFRGLMGWDGHLQLQPTVAQDALRALEALAAGRRPTDWSDANGLRTLLHEMTHSQSPYSYRAYAKAGAVVEEVTVEVSARRAIRKLFPGAPFSLRGASLSYQSWVEGVTKAIAEVGGMGETQAYEALERAALRMRDGSMLYYDRIQDPAKYAKHFAALVFDDAALVGQLVERLGMIE